MKRVGLWVLLGLLLAGCGEQPVFEQVQDVYQAGSPTAAEICLNIPAGGSVAVMGTETDNRLYVCKDYTIAVQTLAGGDLNRTIQALTGFSGDRISLVETREGELRRFDGVWSCAGENGDQVGRLLVLDDGVYHYAVSLMAAAEEAGNLRLAWDTILESVSLNRTETWLPGTDSGRP